MKNSKSGFTGIQAWTIKPRTLQSKVIDCLLYLGVFSGVTLVAYSLLHLQLSVGLCIFGAVLSPISVILRDRRNYIVSATVNPSKRFLYLLASTLGTGCFLGGGATLMFGNGKNSAVYMLMGLLLSVISRYNLKKHRVLGILEDYALHLSSFAGVSFIVAGIALLTREWVIAVAVIILGMLLTPLGLILREKVLLKRRNRNQQRKFFSLVAVTLGMGCSIFGVASLFNGDWLLALLLLEGFLLMLGGSMLNENKVLVSIKDIL